MTVKNPQAREARAAAETAPKVRPDRGGPHHVELVLVGDDLLRGLVADRNASFLAAFVAGRGDRVERVAIVGDDEDAIAEAVRAALGRNPHLVITTGGLGPAPDDRTLKAVASALGRPLAASTAAKELVEAAYQRLYRARLATTAGLNLAREKLTRMPVGAVAVANPRGVCPGVLCRLPGGAFVLCLPGKPEEARAVLEEAAPSLKELARRVEIVSREIESPTADESSLVALLDRLTGEFPGVWIRTRPVGDDAKDSRVLVAIEVTAENRQEANAILGNVQRRLLALASGSP